MLWSDLEFFDPWREIERMEKVLSRLTARSRVEFPAVNLWLNGDEAVVTTELPGIEPGNIDISVIGKSLTLRGSRQTEEAKEGESYHRRERWYGKFSKKIELPFNVDADKVTAKYSKGVLTLHLPRAEAEKPRKISIAAE